MSKHSANVAAAARAAGHNHVTTKRTTNADGFGTGKAPSDTAGYNPTGNKAGAPYHSKTSGLDDAEIKHAGMRNNPYNPHDQDEPGVLGGMIVSKVAPPLSSPVPKDNGHMPDRFGNYKADAVASVTSGTPVGQPVTFPKDGVLGRS